jgi:hypothetical protein
MLNTLTNHPISSSLTSLNQSGNKNISDIGIAAIADTCQQVYQQMFLLHRQRKQ